LLCSCTRMLFEKKTRCEKKGIKTCKKEEQRKQQQIYMSVAAQ